MDIYNIIIQKVINTIPNIYNFTEQTIPASTHASAPASIQFTHPVGPNTTSIQAWHNIFIHEITDSSIQSIVKIIYYMYIDSYYYFKNNNFLLKNGVIIKNTLYSQDLDIFKFQLIDKVFKNPFYNDLTKDNFLTAFCKIQRIYFAFVRFVKIVKYRRASVYNTTDILMNPLHRRHKTNIEIYQNKKIYLFTRPDIINLFNAALSHSPSFFSDPLPIKNPYNNMFFRKSDLYNMYFFVRSGLFIVSDLIQTFFLGNFDLQKFQDDNEYIIRDYSIKSYIENTPTNVLYDEIKRMIFIASLSHKIRIHEEFPKDILVKIMKPYLLLYFQSLFSIDAYKREDCMNTLVLKLIRFNIFNPRFGRQIIKTQKYIKLIPQLNVSKIKFKKFSYKKIVYFNKEYVPFLEKDMQFMTSHT